MPSRNSINKPKLTARKHSRPHKKDMKLLTSSTESPLKTSSAGKMTTKVISKKRAKKDIRNKKYRDEHIKQLLASGDGDVSMEDAGLSKTQLKKQARLEALKLQFERDQPSEEMHYITGEGTTLGGPGW
jgi:hypothetical protein